MPRTRRVLALLFILVAALLVAALSRAGTLPLAWTAVTDPDLAGYRIYWGAATGAYTQSIDVDKVTAYEITGLPDCKDVFVALKARDAAGQLSPAFSAEVKGWPRIDITPTPPRTFEVGGSYLVNLAGSNFRPGALAYLDFGASRILATNVTVPSCSQINFTVPTTVTTPVGAWSLSVENPDATWRVLPGFAATVANAPPAPVSGVKRTDFKP